MRANTNSTTHLISMLPSGTCALQFHDPSHTCTSRCVTYCCLYFSLSSCVVSQNCSSFAPCFDLNCPGSILSVFSAPLVSVESSAAHLHVDSSKRVSSLWPAASSSAVARLVCRRLCLDG